MAHGGRAQEADRLKAAQDTLTSESEAAVTQKCPEGDQQILHT